MIKPEVDIDVELERHGFSRWKNPVLLDPGTRGLPIDVKTTRPLVNIGDVSSAWLNVSQKNKPHAAQTSATIPLTHAEREYQIGTPVSERKRTILETFAGFVDQIEGGVAFVTLCSEQGETIFGEYSASELAKHGIFERRRFSCQTVDVDGFVRVELNPIQDCAITPDEESTIDREIDDLLDGNEFDAGY